MPTYIMSNLGKTILVSSIFEAQSCEKKYVGVNSAELILVLRIGVGLWDSFILL